MNLQRQAPLAQTPSAPSAPQGMPAPQHSPAPEPVPFSAPTMRPGEPVTAGADAGLGPGLGSLNLPNPQTQTYRTVSDALQQLSTVAPQNSEVAALLARMKGGM